MADLNLTTNFDLANEVIAEDNDYDLPDETLLSIPVDELLGHRLMFRRHIDNNFINKFARLNVNLGAR